MRAVEMSARGHANVRATHAKTIELTTDADLTARGTCIVAVAARLDPAALASLAGPVTVTFTAGGAADTVHGLVNPRYDASTGRLVIRRSRHRAPDTLVVAADKGSADLDRSLVRALADGTTDVRVTIAPDDEPADADDHAVLDVDVGAAQAAAARLARGLGAHDTTPVTFAGALPRRALDRRRALEHPEPALVVWRVHAGDLAAVTSVLGDRLVAAITDPATPDERVHRPGDPIAASRVRHAAYVVVRATTAPSPDPDDRLLAALAEAGVPTRTLQDALTAATGMRKRDAYDRVVRARR